MKYKLSHYAIITESFLHKDSFISYSTRSNKMVKIGSYLADMLLSGDYEDIPDETIQYLVKSEILVAEDSMELDSIISENKTHSQEQTTTLFEVIQPSAWCQMGCYYCGQKHKKKQINNALVDSICKRILNKLKIGNYNKLIIGWFGGEPLAGLQSMRKINEILAKECSQINIDLEGTIVTNGLSLKPNIFKELVEEFNILKYEITLDGLYEYHDSHRFLKSSGGTFKIIYSNLLKIFSSDFFDEKKHKITIRCNVDKTNVAGVKDLIFKLAEDKIHNKISKLYFVSIYSWAKNDAHNNSLTKQEFAMLKLKWEVLKFNLGYSGITSITRRKLNTCIATSKDSEMYDTYGNIYNCTEVSFTDVYKDTKYVLGDVRKNTLQQFENKPFYDWFDQIKDNPKYQCHSCKLLPVCGGSCPKSWVEGNPACPPFRHSINKDLQFHQILIEGTKEDLVKFSNDLEINQFQY